MTSGLVSKLFNERKNPYPNSQNPAIEINEISD